MTAETAAIMERVEMLPIDIKLELVDRLLESISPSWEEIDQVWKAEVERRIDEVERGDVELIAGEEVFARIRARYTRNT
jgi:putative addiction module component (TIGR02574 family)